MANKSPSLSARIFATIATWIILGTGLLLFILVIAAVVALLFGVFFG